MLLTELAKQRIIRSFRNRLAPYFAVNNELLFRRTLRPALSVWDGEVTQNLSDSGKVVSKTEFQSDKHQFCDIQCLTICSIFIGHFCSSVHHSGSHPWSYKLWSPIKVCSLKVLTDLISPKNRCSFRSLVNSRWMFGLRLIVKAQCQEQCWSPPHQTLHLTHP